MMTERKATFSTTQACRLAGITYRQIDYYDRSGLIDPTQPARGSGSQRRWTSREVDALRVLGRLMSLRAYNGSDTNQRFREIAAHVAEHGAAGSFDIIPGVTVDIEKLVA